MARGFEQRNLAEDVAAAFDQGLFGGMFVAQYAREEKKSDDIFDVVVAAGHALKFAFLTDGAIGVGALAFEAMTHFREIARERFWIGESPRDAFVDLAKRVG